MLSYVNYIYPRNWCMHIIGIEHNVVIGTKRMEQYRDGGEASVCTILCCKAEAC